MKKALLSILILFLIGFISIDASAQEEKLAANEHSVYPIPYNNQMYKRTVWRRMDFKEKQNRPFFSTSNELTRIIIDAVTDGLLYAYEDDSLNKRMSKEQFFEKLKLPTDEEDDFGSTDSGFGDDTGGGWGDEEETVSAAQYFDATQLYIMLIKEDMIFDKVRSRLYWDIQSFELMIPQDQTATGLELSAGVFKYQDLEKLFRSMPDRAIWYNRQNTAHHRNMADAFLLRLFNARVVKIANDRDDWIQDIAPDAKSALYKSQQEEYKLIEYEHNLWEY